MLKMLRISIICIGVLAIAVWIISSSEAFQSCIQAAPQHPSSQSFQESISQVLIATPLYRGCVGAFIRDNGESIIAALTAILALSTVFLWIATRDLVRGTGRIAETQLRAFVFAKGIQQAFSTETEANGTKRINGHLFWAEIENVGLTPATDAKAWIRHQTLPMTENREPHFEWREVGALSVIGPRGTGKTRYEFVPIETLLELWERKTEIFIATRIEYRDIFNPKILHHHEQCLILDLLYRPDEKRPQGNPPPVTMTAYGPHNSVK